LDTDDGRWAFSVLFVSMHKVFDELSMISFTFVSIILYIQLPLVSAQNLSFEI